MSLSHLRDLYFFESRITPLLYEKNCQFLKLHLKEINIYSNKAYLFHIVITLFNKFSNIHATHTYYLLQIICCLLNMWVYSKDEVRRYDFTTLPMVQINPNIKKNDNLSLDN